MKSYILIDRSGSMTGNWKETIGAVNAYVEELAKEKVAKKADVTVSVFDSGKVYEVIRESVKVADWKPISENEVTPRGSTPLFDAIGQLSSKIKEAAPSKASIIILTDGKENASREINREGAKKLLDELREKKYDVTFIGADFDAFAQGSSVGVGAAGVLNMTKGNYEGSFRSLANKTAMYGEHGAEAVMNFFDDNNVREKAQGK